ncbi:dihydroorotase [Gleimia coleocanis DSM 15436]|uniref:Dihydroorotase n=1 Tax=Gleimia coleocanis DSM 15436 TaxID=525245 RepID=C0W1L5_9ACTO|nr:dihydroorotase [Gleimia coleocanis]EEH63381.1 dihydroorotase [Gleimia coleocanis DSM 15436]
MTNNQILIKGALPYGEDATDIAVADGKIVALGKDAGDALVNPEIVNAEGLVALPGLVDLHTHLREPGQEDAETVYTGTRAGAAGGYTCVHAMANTNPVADTAAIVEQVQTLGDAAGWLQVRPVGAVTVGLEGKQLSAMSAMATSKAKVRVFSDDGMCVSDPLLMRRALEYVKTFNGVIAQHAQDPILTAGAQMNESALSAQLGLAGWPAVAEEAIIARDISLAKHVDSRLHVCHVSTAGSVELIRWAKSKGIRVTAEVTPHHLFLTEEEACSYDPLFKVNPPLRTFEDVEALREGLADGTIDIVGTDHAPHPLEKKDCEWQAGAFGMTGLETALPVVITTMVNSDRMSWRDVARVLSEAPAQIGQVAEQGHKIAVGSLAQLTFVDPTVVRTVDPKTQWTKSTNTPFIGHDLAGQVLYTMYNGQFTVREGQPIAKENR